MPRNQAAPRTLLLLVLSASCLVRSALAAVPQETVLHSFAGAPVDGSLPDVGVVADKAGNMYGTTQYGGTTGNGTVFKLSPPSTKGGQWTESVLYSFQGGADGFTPYATPVLDAPGNLYGTTIMGGANNLGIVYQLSRRPCREALGQKLFCTCSREAQMGHIQAATRLLT
ncbi:MAG TPA: choice-of-anchor tandem repeat GloVer-containing protein [Candidatus Sulfotelmatobacter sp.]